METIKSAIGLGKKDQEGQEPVSGQQGEGSAVEPYDAGNQDNSHLGGKAPQQTDPDQVTGEVPTTTQSQTADADATESGKSEPIAPATESESSKESPSSKKPAIGSSSWFKTALPFGKPKASGQEQDEPQVAAGASGAVNGTETTKDTVETKETEANLPPNHLGEQVPVGHSTDLEAPNQASAVDTMASTANGTQPEEPTATDQTAKEPQAEQQQQQAPTFVTSMFGSSSNKDEQAQDSTNKSTIEQPTAAPLAKDKQPARDSAARGSNPHAIPTAGGVPLGARASEDRERRKSRSVDISRNASLNVPREEVPPVPQPPAAEKISEQTAETPAASSSLTESKDEKSEQSADAVDAAKTSNVPSSLSAPAAEKPAQAGKNKDRRRSIFDKIKEKVKK